MDIEEQIARGYVVCPRTKQPLKRIGQTLAAGPNAYEMKGGVPIMLTAPDVTAQYAGQMTSEYEEHRKLSWFARLKQQDYRTPESTRALRIFGIGPDALCISIGGGPFRLNETLTNLNLGPFPNVDIVGDAHELPYADNCVDAIFCEAVLEHLHTPALAVREMRRVLKPGGKIFACTPFLQPYHGYPHHYQNFTITGHRQLFSDFVIEESGVCVGPLHTVRLLVGLFLRTYLPFPLNRLLHAAWSALMLVLAPLGRVIARHPQAHVMASTTYLIARKP